MTSLRLELVKVLHMKRTYLGWLALVLVPIVITVAVALTPPETGPPDPGQPPFTYRVAENGLLVVLSSLTLMGFFLLPLIAAMGGASTISTEAERGTLKTWLSRPVRRGEVLFSKWAIAVLYAAIGVGLAVFVGLVLGALAFGLRPLVTLSGSTLDLPHAVGLIAAASGLVLLGALCSLSLGLLLSTFADSSLTAVIIAIVVYTVLSILNSFSYFDFMKPYTYTTYRLVFINLFRHPIYWRPIEEALLDYGVTVGGVLLAAWLVFARRDILT